jgi:class 3 adenylate cyclase
VALVMLTADFAAFISAYPAVLKIVENQIYGRLREAPTLRAAGRQPDLSGGPADDWTALNRYPKSAASSVLSGQNCTIVRTDVVGFGAASRSDDHRRIIRHACLATTRAAMASAWDMSRREDRGDGLLIIVPPGIPTTKVIERLVMILPHELKRHNHIYGGPARIQLRVAVTVGPVEEDSAGVAGKAIIQASRMLDAPAFKQAIADQAAVLGIVVSPFVYETHIQPGGSFLDPSEYAEVPVRVKETSSSAWMQLIDPSGSAPSSHGQLMPRT